MKGKKEDGKGKRKRKYFKYMRFRKNMVKKSVVFLVFCFIFILLLLSCFVLAQETEGSKVAEAYDWLISKVRGNWNDLTTKQHAFSLLALYCNTTYTKPGITSLNSKAYIGENIKCWGHEPKPTSPQQCLLTETALAKMVLDEFDENTTRIKNWLLGQNMTQIQGIGWYLQIDIERGYNATCSVIYAGHDEKFVFKVNKDKTVEILNTTDCFRHTYKNYWFEVEKSQACYSHVYTIKCWSDAEVYRVSLLYKKPGSDVWHVSSETKSGRPGVPGSNNIKDQPQPLELRIPSYCLSNPFNIGVCDYEGTAWTAYVLSRQGDTENANLFIPYLVVFAEENIRWFPESFLYPLTSQTRYSDSILNAQKIVGVDKGYWLIQPIVYGRVYDTAHAGLALGGAGDAITKTKNYLIANQEPNGNLVSSAYGESGKDSVRDTAFALWVFWPYLCPGVGGISEGCEDQGINFRCIENVTCGPEEVEVPFECPAGQICCKEIGGGALECTDADGTCKEECDEGTEFKIWEIICPDWEYCCKKYEDATCEEVEGELCGFDEECSGTEVYTLNGSCCLGSCIPGNAYEQYCIDIGVECDSGEVCINDLTWDVIGFTTTLDTEMCCVGTSVKCVQDVNCDAIGEKCEIGEDCVGGTIEGTKDEEYCCTGKCVGSCSRQGGTPCIGDEECNVNYIEASDTNRCCPAHGECKKPASLWWLWIILILVAIIGFVLYYFKFRKPPKPKKKPELFPGAISLRKPVMPTRMPTQVRMPTRPMTRPARPMTRAPRPAGPLPKVKRGKSEEELEKTLRKLKKMAKK